MRKVGGSAERPGEDVEVCVVVPFVVFADGAGVSDNGYLSPSYVRLLLTLVYFQACLPQLLWRTSELLIWWTQY